MTDTNQPNVFASESMQFIEAHTDLSGLRILEVGCGSGHLGRLVADKAAHFTAIDTDEHAVASAREKGLHAICADFLTYEDEAFDVLLFTRSLHHIHHLTAAMQQAGKLLKKDGWIFLEEFDLEHVDYKTLRWYYDMRTLFAHAQIAEGPVQRIDDPLEQWKSDHHHEHALHTGSQMTEALRAHFHLSWMGRNAYFYRSICASLRASEQAFALTKHVLDIEENLISEGTILPNGLRAVGRKP